MMRAREDEIIELRAVTPDGDLACDTTIATAEERSGLADALAGGMIPPVRRLQNGVEVTFRPDAREHVLRYVELESQCCSFLDLSVKDEDGSLVLTVTGRPEARDWIYNIFEQA